MADNFDPPRNQRKQLQHRRKSSQSQPRSTQSLGSAVKASATQTLSIPESVNTAVIQDDYSHEQMEYTWEMRGGEEMSGVSECAITDETNSSWLVIGEARHQRSYSNESNRISDAVSDGPCLSTPSDGRPEWTYAPPYTAVREDNYFPDLGHNDPLLLSDLSDPGPQTPYESFQHAPSSSGDYQGSDDNNSIQYPDPSRTIELPHKSSNSRVYHGTEESWNQLERRVPQYDPGYAVFAPLSPSESLINGIPSPRRAESKSKSKSKSKSSEKKPHSPRSKKAVKGKENTRASALGWEHTVVGKGGLERVLEYAQKEPVHPKSGCRKGKLNPETKEKAKRVRKVGACWPCWLMKVPCSEDKICDRCRKQVSKCSPMNEQLCYRAGFADYEATFFGQRLGFLHSHLSRQQITQLTNENVNRFVDRTIEAEVSTGQCFHPMKVLVNYFQPKGSDLLSVHHITAVTELSSPQLVRHDSAPVGMMALSTSEMKIVCRDHIEKMVQNGEYALETTSGDPTQIPFLVLEVVTNYAFAGNVSSIRKASCLHACHYFMSRLVTFSDETADEIHQIVSPYGPPRERYYSSRLLSRQLKYTMHKLHREIMKEVLEGLEKSLRTRTKDSWGPSFCTILVLCLCIENLQTAADTFIVCDVQKSEDEGTTSQYRREHSIAACQDLDSYPFQQSTRLFHDIYRSHRSNREAGGAKDGFNPLRLAQNGEATGLDEATNAMITHVLWVIHENYSEIRELSQRPYMVDDNASCDELIRDIRSNNTGRLVSKFLMSFFPDHS